MDDDNDDPPLEMQHIADTIAECRPPSLAPRSQQLRDVKGEYEMRLQHV